MSRRARTRRDKRAPQPDFDDTTAAFGRGSNSRPSAPKAAMQPFKINSLGNFCLTALCF